MDDWSKNIFEMLESVTCVVDEFLLGVTEMVEEIADDVQSTLSLDFEQSIQEMFAPIAEIYFELEDLVNETEQGFTYPVAPTPELHPACVGCHHYHGQVYSGNLLVCAMHPYGWDTADCPDWESFQPGR